MLRKFTLNNYKLFISDADWKCLFPVSVEDCSWHVVLYRIYKYVQLCFIQNNLMFKKGYRFLAVFTMYFSED